MRGWTAAVAGRAAGVEVFPAHAGMSGMWEPGARLWCIEPRRIGPVLRQLRRATDPLFRQAGIDLDEG